MPAESALVISPGTVKTSRPSSSARSAVMSAPLRSRASTTTVAAQRPATIRLRAGKRQGAGSTPGAYSETSKPDARDATRELGVSSGVVAVDAAAEHGDGDAVRLERAAVCLGVDAPCQSRDDDEACARELSPERARDRSAVARAGSCADDRNSGAGEQLGVAVAAQEEPRRRVVDRPQQRREMCRESRQEADAALGEPPLVHRGVEGSQMRRPAPVLRRPNQVRSGLGREYRERQLGHAASSCGER